MNAAVVVWITQTDHLRPFFVFVVLSMRCRRKLWSMYGWTKVALPCFPSVRKKAWKVTRAQWTLRSWSSKLGNSLVPRSTQAQKTDCPRCSSMETSLPPSYPLYRIVDLLLRSRWAELLNLFQCPTTDLEEMGPRRTTTTVHGRVEERTYFYTSRVETSSFDSLRCPRFPDARDAFVMTLRRVAALWRNHPLPSFHNDLSIDGAIWVYRRSSWNLAAAHTSWGSERSVPTYHHANRLKVEF